LEQILGYCSARELGALEATCQFFIKSGITEKVAQHFLREIPRAKGLKPEFRCAQPPVAPTLARPPAPAPPNPWPPHPAR
jgi:hypothetical protein